MQDLVQVVSYSVLAIINLIMIVKLFKQRKTLRVWGYLWFTFVGIFFWQINQIVYYSTRSFSLASKLFDMDLFWLSFSMCCMMLYIFKFFDIGFVDSPAFQVIAFMIPATNFFLALTQEFHPFFRSELTILSVFPLHSSFNVRGPWFWVHTFYCYSLVAVTLVICLFQMRKHAKFYRLPTAYMLLSLALAVAGNVVFLLFPGIIFDMSLISASISAFFLYLSATGDNGLESLLQARHDVFDELDEALILMDLDNQILETNRAADSWIDQITTDGQLPEFVMDYFTLARENSSASLTLGGRTFSIHPLPISQSDSGSKVFGYYYTVLDVTENRKIRKQLDMDAGMDALTGLFNRRRLEQIKNDSTFFQPTLGILLGDLNNLKMVNDTLGHQQGDLLIRLASNTLQEICPPRGHVFRIGGDEFLMLLPGATQQELEALMEDIDDTFAATELGGFAPSIAMGCSLWTSFDIDFEACMKEADRKMYRDKARKKSVET